MLAANINVIAPDAQDPLREILKDLGEVGEEKDVLGEDGKAGMSAGTGLLSAEQEVCYGLGCTSLLTFVCLLTLSCLICQNRRKWPKAKCRWL